MSLRLVPRVADPLHFADLAVSRLRFDMSRRADAGAGARRRALLSDADLVEDRRGEVLFPDEAGFHDPGNEQGSDDGLSHAHDLMPDHSSDTAPDHTAARAQAEAEDIAVVRLAASRLAVALREVPTLLRGAQGVRRSDALARCTAKGWITLQGDPWAASQTFRVTPEGYRAAGLRVPPFVT